MKTNCWQVIVSEAKNTIKNEPIMSSYLTITILEYENILDAAINILSEKLGNGFLSNKELHVVFKDAIYNSKKIQQCIIEDLLAIRERDPASLSLLNPFLNYKGYHALEAYRVTNWLWKEKRYDLALLLQSQISMRFGIDIHPAAEIGRRVFLIMLQVL